MKNNRKILLMCMVIFVCAAGKLFSLETPRSLEGLESSVSIFSKNMARSLPFNSSLGLNWSDAYIGQLIDIPPHFGVGIAGGFTTIEASSIERLMQQFYLELPVNMGGFPIPGYTLEGRIGGFGLPFDIGVKIGYMDLKDLKPDDIGMNYLLVGGDIRFEVLKGNVILPTVSVGAGFNYLNGGISASKPGDILEFECDGMYSLNLDSPKINLVWETKTLDLKAQVSKTFFFVTPYLGVGMSYAWSSAGYKVGVKLTDKHDNDLDEDAIAAIKNLGIDIPGNGKNGFSSIKTVDGFSTRAYGGLSFNIQNIKIDLTGMYNFIDSRYGVSLGVRFQTPEKEKTPREKEVRKPGGDAEEELLENFEA
ncbi:MAG: hypothetical protein LBH43_11910 [Treponema sp.]|nr:hypothetical protein [Treponema sp.]